MEIKIKKEIRNRTRRSEPSLPRHARTHPGETVRRRKERDRKTKTKRKQLERETKIKKEIRKSGLPRLPQRKQQRKAGTAR